MSCSYSKLRITLIALADAQVCELVAEEVIFANAINNNYKTAKSFEAFVEDCKRMFSYRRNELLSKRLIKQYGFLTWERRQRSIRQPHLLFISRKYPEYVRTYFKQQGFLSHMVREDESL